MNLREIKAKAKRQGFLVLNGKEGKKKLFSIIDTKHTINPVIHTDKTGLESFILGGVDQYLSYCELANVEPF